MRLDKYLKVSRIIKRRTVSNDACDAGRVQVNGKQQKAGYQVKAGDIIAITFGEKVHKFKILLTDDVVARKLGEPMFEEVQ